VQQGPDHSPTQYDKVLITALHSTTRSWSQSYTVQQGPDHSPTEYKVLITVLHSTTRS